MQKKKCLIIYAITFLLLGSLIVINISLSKKQKYKSHDDFIIATYIDGEFSNNLPSKDDPYLFEKMECSNGANLTWDNDNWGFSVENDIKNTKCVLYFKFKKVLEYDYTGTEETYTVYKDGLYKIEAWGAQGGGSAGGKGGYTSGVIFLNKGTKLYLNIGGSGDSLGHGGYNGGGDAGVLVKNNDGGGGASDIRLSSSLNDRIMVAGGGGGANTAGENTAGIGKTGGSGGGINGINGISVINAMSGGGGTQTTGGAAGNSGDPNRRPGSAGTFGQGGTGTYSKNTPKATGGAGGGGGYYGGGASEACLSNCGGSSGGGSSYISGHTGCVGITSLKDSSPKENCSDGTIDTKCSYHYSNYIFTNTKILSGNDVMPTVDDQSTMIGKTGNGYAKITYLGNVNVEYYIDNVKSHSVANKTTYNFDKVECSNGSNLTWDNDNWKFVINDYQENDTCKIYFSSKTTIELAYTGAEEKIVIPKTGFYKLETWGAQGGDANNYSGGSGGYSYGTIRLNKNDVLYINIGGSGSESNVSRTGGYNGGGTSTKNGGQTGSKQGSGGGATHIALKSGLLSSLKSNEDSILIVAGGGGGADYWPGGWQNLSYQYGLGGSGGGYQGVNGTSYCNGFSNPSCHIFGHGGTQIAGGSSGGSSSGFGQGGNAATINAGGAGGGGGYYGGGGSSDNAGGGGGSGYIGNSLLSSKAMYCYNCTESSEEETKTVTTTCNEATPTENCAKKGNGYARITFIK